MPNVDTVSPMTRRQWSWGLH